MASSLVNDKNVGERSSIIAFLVTCLTDLGFSSTAS
jgi:hypothetical protein